MWPQQDPKPPCASAFALLVGARETTPHGCEPWDNILMAQGSCSIRGAKQLHRMTLDTSWVSSVPGNGHADPAPITDLVPRERPS